MASRTRKISVVGARGVGKSTLVVQYVDNYFLESYYPTIQNQFNKSISFRGQTYEVEVLDTAGQDEFTILQDSSTLVHGYILVYAVNSRSSFELLPVIRDKILEFTGTDKVPMILVGNKLDLERKVGHDEGVKLAREFGIPYIEISAKTTSEQDISRIFIGLLEQIEGEKIDTENEKCVIM